MAITHRQTYSSGSSAISQSAAFASSVLAGSLIVLTCRDGGTTANPTITDSQSNTWAKVSGARNLQMWYAVTGLAGTLTVTITSASTTSIRWAMAEYEGVFASVPLSGTPATTSPTTAPASPVTGNQTTTGAALLVAAIGSQTSVSAMSVDANWTLTGNGNQRVYGARRVVTAAGTYNATFTQTGGSTIDTIIATFVESDGGASETVRTRLRKSLLYRTYF